MTSTTLFQTIIFGIDFASSSERTFSTASICCSASGWLQYMEITIRSQWTSYKDACLSSEIYLISTTCTRSDDSEISSSVALKAATYSNKVRYVEAKELIHTQKTLNLWNRWNGVTGLLKVMKLRITGALTKVVGNFWIKPTVSVRRNSFPFFICTKQL